MNLSSRTFIELSNNVLGHITTFKKKNGNTYYVFYIECRYAGFQEISNDGLSIIDCGGIEPFKDYSVFKIISYG